MWNNTELLANRIKRLVDEALILGRQPQILVNQLQKEFGVSYSYANRLIRTELSHTFNQASMVAYKAAGLMRVEVLVGKDERLCEVCAAAEGTYYIGSEPMLPAHPHCRCCYSPIVEEATDEEYYEEE